MSTSRATVPPLPAELAQEAAFFSTAWLKLAIRHLASEDPTLTEARRRLHEALALVYSADSLLPTDRLRVSECDRLASLGAREPAAATPQPQPVAPLPGQTELVPRPPDDLPF